MVTACHRPSGTLTLTLTPTLTPTLTLTLTLILALTLTLTPTSTRRPRTIDHGGAPSTAWGGSQDGCRRLHYMPLHYHSSYTSTTPCTAILPLHRGSNHRHARGLTLQPA